MWSPLLSSLRAVASPRTMRVRAWAGKTLPHPGVSSLLALGSPCPPPAFPQGSEALAGERMRSPPPERPETSASFGRWSPGPLSAPLPSRSVRAPSAPHKERGRSLSEGAALDRFPFGWFGDPEETPTIWRY